MRRVPIFMEATISFSPLLPCTLAFLTQLNIIISALAVTCFTVLPFPLLQIGCVHPAVCFATATTDNDDNDPGQLRCTYT